MSNILISDKVSQLLTVVEEATRSSEEGVKYFVEPAHGTLRRSVALKRRDLQMVEFWKPDAEDKLRRVSLIFDDGNGNKT